MSLVGFKGQNHRQQTEKRGAQDHVDDRGTPPELFDPLMQRFGFTLDVAAAPHNAKCERFYSIEDNGLERPWTGRVWCNPPYSNLAAWTAKANAEWRWAEGWPDPDALRWDGSLYPQPLRPEVIVMLLPANRTEQSWWQDQIEPRRLAGLLRVEFLRGRQRFIMPGQTEVLPNQRPPFGVCLAIWSAA